MSMGRNKKISNRLLAIIAFAIALNLLGKIVYKRFDLTQDKRYTLSEASKNIIKDLDTPIIVDVLLQGNFPAEFKRLQAETRQLLEEFASVNNNIKFNFTDPLEGAADKEETMSKLQGFGLTPASVTVEEGGKVSQEWIFPWAMANMGDRTVRVSLLKNKLGATSEERVNSSVQQLEYAFADAFSKLTTKTKKKVAVLRGNGELGDMYLADFLTNLREHYNIAPFTLDSVSANPQRTLEGLNEYDLAIIAKPTERFTDEEKQVLDQYTMNGGKSLWLMDMVHIELDSLFNQTGRSLAYPVDLNLNDMFFKYGIRINPVLVNDLYFTQIVIAAGDGSASEYNPVPWLYSPMVFSGNDHPVNNNLEALRFQFANTIDTLSNDIKKTVLLRSSALSKIVGAPREISLEEITNKPDKETYNNGYLPLAVLLEGSFTSVFKNRVKPFKNTNELEDGKESKMIVIADGDLIKNQLNKGRPLELGYDKWTNNFYGNKEFLLNCVNYLLDDGGLINIRSKEVKLPFLDTEKVAVQKDSWKLINTGLPVMILLICGWFYTRYRRGKYTS